MSKRKRAKQAMRRMPTAPRAPRPRASEPASKAADDSVLYPGATPSSRGRRMQHLANSSFVAMMDELPRILEPDDLGTYALDYLTILGIDEEEMPDEPLFLDWMLYFGSRTGSSLADEFLKGTVAERFIEGGYGSQEQRRFIDLARRQPLSYWRIEEVGPGPWLSLSDMFVPRTQRVFAEDFPRVNMRGLALLGHVVADGDVAVLAAVADDVWGPWVQYAVRLLVEFFAPQIDHPVRLLEFDTELLDLYGTALHQSGRLAQTAPRTSDGHPTVLTTVRFEYAHRALDDLLDPLREEPDFEPEPPNPEFSTSVEVGWAGPPMVDGPRILPHGTIGVLEVADGSIQAHTNSAERVAHLQARLEQLLGPPSKALTLSATSVTVEPPLPRLVMAGVERVAKRIMRKRFLAWADAAHPGLGDRSPREVCAAPGGAARIAAMLDAWQNRARAAELGYQDFAALRASLDLEGEG